MTADAALPAPTAEAFAFLARPHCLFIGGDWREGRGERAIGNPAREDVIAQVRSASQADVDDAVAVARAAFEAPGAAWPAASEAGSCSASPTCSTPARR